MSEEGLVGGNPDTDPSGIDTTNAKEVSGTASFTDADSPAGSVFSAELSAVGLPTDWKSGGQSISWSIESGSGDLVGNTSSEEIIRVHIDNVDSSAREVNYTVTLQGPIDHPDAAIEDNLSFDVPLIVKDELDNPGTGVITVTIEDDSPDQTDSISQGYVEEEALQPEGNLDTNDHPNMEDDGDGNNAVWSSSVSGLFSIGADRPGSYSINSSVNGTAVVTTGGDAVTSGEAALTYNVVNATTLQGVADGRVVFEVVLDQSTGDYTFTLEDQLDHHPVESADDIEGYLNLELSGTITVQDEDDDTVGLDANSLVITVQDDVPVDIDPDDAFMSNVAGTTVTEPLDYFGNIGADEPGTVKFLQSYDGALLLDSGGDPVQSEGKSVVLVLSADGTVLTGYLESETTPGDPDLSEPVIQITLNPDGDTQANDIYTVELFKKIDDGSGTDFNDFSQVTAGNNKWIGIDGDGVPINSVSDPDTNSRDLLITPIDPADTINNDSDDIAVSNQWIDNGEGIRIDFVQGLDYATGQDQSDPWNGVPAPFDYSAHYESNSFEFKIIQVQTSGGTANVRISAVNADDDDFLTGDAGDVSVLISASDVSVESTGTITITQDGNDVVVTGLEAGDKIYFSTDDPFDRVLVSNDGGADDFALGAFGVSTVRAGSPVSMDFDVEITDADGDKAGGDFTVTLDSPVLVVGKNVDDVDGQTEDHAVPNPNLDSAGEIVGGSANDILVGDIGGSSVEGKDLNLVIVIDTSGSMAFAFDGGVPNEPGEQSRLTILKESVNELLDELAAGDAENIRVHIVEYSGWPQSGYPGHSQTEPDAWVVGTYDLKTDGSANATELNDAKSDVNALNAEGGTNYEAGLQQAISWWSNPANPLSGDNVVNQTIFLSDGEPTFWYSGNSSNLTIGPGGFYHSDALAHITGTHTVRNPSYDPSSNWQDTVSEVDLLNSYGIVESVAINLPDNSSGLDVMDVIEGESPGSGASDNVKNPEDLSEVLQDISPLNKLADAGGDTVVGNEGADIIFGDALFTDTLAANQGLDMNPGSGYQVFRALENGESTVSPDWSRDDTINYIVNNMEELSQESVTSEGKRQGANDTIFGGEGNDIIYGQEGDDVIHGGDDNDYLDGGSGADELYGDDGDDVLIYDSADTVVDGGAGIDILRLENGDDIDFNLLVPNPIDNIEVIDLDNDIDANSLSNLSAQDVLDMTDSDNELFIIGDNGDSVSGSGSWNAQGSQSIGGVNYDVYTGTSNSQTVTLYVQDTINDSF